jgi:alpha-tubulin suppressor-like RCC1 family protein
MRIQLFALLSLVVGAVACGAGAGSPESTSQPCQSVPIQAMALGDAHTCALTMSGGVRCWGANDRGQLGDGLGVGRAVPPSTDVLTGVRAIAAGSAHTCALMTTGGLRCWGSNDLGQLGDGTTTDRDTPPSTDVLTGVQAMAAGSTAKMGYTCALMVSGGVRCWGSNYGGQLGDGTNQGRSSPPDSDVLTRVFAIAANRGDNSSLLGGVPFACALTVEGGVRCWGNNDYGQLGDGTLASRLTPPAVDVLSGVQAIAIGSTHTCALTIAGGVRCWGCGAAGEMGDGTITWERTTPPFNDAIDSVAAITAGAQHTCALLSNGGVRCWGSNMYGVLGLGYTSKVGVPTVPSADVLSDAQGVAAGSWHSCAILRDGSVRCWGRNDSGELGDGTTNNQFSPTPVLPMCD